MTIGIYLLILLGLGYLTVYLRERFVNWKILKPITWLGIFIHEGCHALACLVMGGKITGFRVTSTEGSVTHYWPKVPIIGPFAVAVAPLLGGLLILGTVNHFVLSDALNNSGGLLSSLSSVWQLLTGFTWSSLVILFFLLNVGVMIGPSLEDLKNIWPIIVLLLFLKNSGVIELLSLAIVLVFLNICFFLLFLLIKKIWNRWFARRKRNRI